MKKFVVASLSSLLFASVALADSYYSVDVINRAVGFETLGSLNCRICPGKTCDVLTVIPGGGDVTSVVTAVKNAWNEASVQFVWDTAAQENKLWFYTNYGCWVTANRNYLRAVWSAE